MNEMYQIAEKSNVNWDDAVAGFVADGRIGHSHLNVPGHDGKFGFGGSCFPKDIQAIINFSEELNVDMSVLKGVWKTNLKVRPERDWEQLKGRAVIDE
jgi:UDPglucose 6-dehydrogenase